MAAQAKRHVWRYWVVGCGLTAASFALGARCWHLSQDPDLKKQALAQQTRRLDPFIPRLPLVDRRQIILATDQPLLTLYAHPPALWEDAKKQILQMNQGQLDLARSQRNFEQQSEVAAQLLAPLIKVPVNTLRDQLRDQRRSTVILSRRIDDSTATQIKNLIVPRTPVDDLTPYLAQDLKNMPRANRLRIAGLDWEVRQQRTYPLGAQMAAVLGFVDFDGVGRAGIERSYQKTIVLDADPQSAQFNGFNQMLAAQAPPVLINQHLHQQLRLTLDSRLQGSAYRALAQGMTAYKAARGAAIIMDPKTGAILALAVAPTYDNNMFGDYAKQAKIFQPWPVTEIYEPGSTFKPINIALGLDSGKVKATDVIYDPGTLTLSKRTIRNFDGRGRGSLNVTQVLQVSNNIGMVKLMQKLAPGDYYDRLRGIGIGKNSGVDLPDEAAGIFKTRAQFVRYPIESATPAFGQGITMTPLQLLRYHCAIANGGWLVKPHLVDAILDNTGQVVQSLAPAPTRRIFSEEATRQVRQMLIAVVEGGSGKPAQVPGYWVGGKTGTAQKVRSDGRGYVEGKRVTSFVAHFPGDAPRYVMLVVFDDPPGRAFGGTTAAPVAHQILTELIGYEGISPSRPLTKAQAKNDALN